MGGIAYGVGSLHTISPFFILYSFSDLFNSWSLASNALLSACCFVVKSGVMYIYLLYIDGIVFVA